VTAGRPPGPWVGDTVYDTEKRAWLVVTDVRERGRDRPEYVLRYPLGGGEQWSTTDPRRLRLDGPE
jgi:hypothetical protein